MPGNGLDVIVLGGGPAGERAAVQAARAGQRVLLVEQEHVVGGTCVNWGTIPSKTLRESALFVLSLTTHMIEGVHCDIRRPFSMDEVMVRKRRVVQRELELINLALDENRVELAEGSGRFLDPHTISIVDRGGRPIRQVTGQVIVIAVGSRPNRPPELNFDGQALFDSDSILQLDTIPQSMIVLGAGVIGVEYACIFAALGVRVTLVDAREQLLPYLDREMAGSLQEGLRRLGIILVSNENYRTIRRIDAARPAIRLETFSGALFTADLLLYCQGRDGNTAALGLEKIGIHPDRRGLLSVNEFYQTAHPHIYAIGDVIGYPALASTSAEQGRQAMNHAFHYPDPIGRTDSLPFAIYAIPEISFVGAGEEELRKKNIDYVVGRGRYEMNPRGQILDDRHGILKLLFEAGSLRLLGAHMVGVNASELIHIGHAFLRNGADAWLIAETLYNYPTLSDLYRHAAWEAIAAHRRRRAV